MDLTYEVVGDQITNPTTHGWIRDFWLHVQNNFNPLFKFFFYDNT
jgi:hypothetical protein